MCVVQCGRVSGDERHRSGGGRLRSVRPGRVSVVPVYLRLLNVSSSGGIILPEQKDPRSLSGAVP